MGLALPHQLWNGAHFVTSPAATAYWWTQGGGAPAALPVFRVGRPLWLSRRHRLTVGEVRPTGYEGLLIDRAGQARVTGRFGRAPR